MQEWEVSQILLHKSGGSGGRKNYLVAYIGNDKSKDFWLTESELQNALKILNDYRVSHGLS